MLKYLTGIALLWPLSTARAQALTPPPIVLEGLQALPGKGVEQAVAIWLKGSALENDTAAAGQIVRQFSNLPDWMGRPVGSEIIRVFPVGAQYSRTYALIHCQGAPLFVRFDYYQSSRGWILQHLDFNSDATKVFPQSLLSP